MDDGWGPDVLGAGFEARTIKLGPDDEGEVVATLVRHRAAAPTGRAVLYVHGFVDYFFQADLARFFAARGDDFYAIDLRKYGRSWRDHQTPNLCTDLADYDADLDAAVKVILDDDGHDELVIVAHSTGGLIAPLWLRRRPDLPVIGLVLNSPFFELREPWALRTTVGPLVKAVGRYFPSVVVPPGLEPGYPMSIHADYHGEWNFNLQWKPIEAFPVYTGWLRAVLHGQERLHRGLGLTVPTLVLCAARGGHFRHYDPELQTVDGVLDPDAIARWSPALGTHVTVVRIAEGIHDLVLSKPAVRAVVYETCSRWLDAWVEAETAPAANELGHGAEVPE